MFELRRSSVLSGVLLLAGLCACGDESAPAPALPGEAPSRVAGASDPTQAPELSIPADAPLVVFLGDSIAAGLHLPAHQAFPAVLQRELAADGLPFRLVNAGVSGDTSAGGLRRIDWILQQKPTVLVIELGGNDGLRGQDLASVESNLRAIATRALAAGARVLLLGVQIPTSYGADYAGGFAAIYTRLSQELGVELVPEFLSGVGGVPEMNLEDGLHPTAKGHEKIAQTVAPALRKVLER
jgi:acyl-CoA thioesterase-1